VINSDKWIDSIPNSSVKSNEELNHLDSNKWINTISKKKRVNRITKYSITTFIFVIGLMIVSAVKNETRNLQKEINNLQASINITQFNLDRATLDNEVLTSPENISRLAKEYLYSDFRVYKKSQIKNLDIPKKKMSFKIKSSLSSKIEEKKIEIKKLQNLYSSTGSISGGIKTQIAKKIKKKKVELKNLYNNPSDTVASKKVKKWALMQIVKVFLGVPVVPGK
jgi:hypothetical protein